MIFFTNFNFVKWHQTAKKHAKFSRMHRVCLLFYISMNHKMEDSFLKLVDSFGFGFLTLFILLGNLINVY